MFRLIRAHHHSPCFVPKLVTALAKMSSTSTPKSHSLSLVKKATQIVYGPLDTPLSSPSAASNWTPPSSPGAGGHRGRYLWTDAFGVINFITLSQECNNPSYLTLAKRLVSTVHSTLGFTRDLRHRLLLSTEEEPLKGGLRIGKIDEFGRDGDGQYHHYLTLWMFALNRLALATREVEWNRMAIQLAKGIHPYFVFRRDSGSSGGNKKRMVWKVSMDLRSVLVPSEGHLDAATGYVVYSLLRKTAEDFGEDPVSGALLENEIADYKDIMGREGKLSVSSDPLDLGMGLWMCHFFRGKEEWAGKIGEESLEVARVVLGENSGLMRRDASRRLAFREFGTCMGLKCYGITEDGDLEGEVEKVLKFWEKYLDGSTEEDLRPISLVMFATALIPGAFRDGYLDRRES